MAAAGDAPLPGLADAALELTAAAEVDDVLRIVTDAAVELIGAHQGVTSRLVHGWDAASTYIALSDKYAEYRDYDVVPKGLGVLNYVTRENKPLRLTAEELVAHPEWRGLRDAPGHPPLPNYLAAPLIGHDGVNLGLIQLSDKDGGEFTAEDEAVLVQLAQMASGSIENIEARGRLEASVAELEAEKRIVETLYRVGQAIGTRLELHEVVQLVTDAATELTHAEFGAFFYNVLRPDGGAYTLYTLSGAPREAFERFPMPRATEIFEPTFHGTGIVRLDDVTTDARFGKNAPYNGMPKGHLPVRSYLAVPVVASDGEVLGGLFFGHAEVGVFSEESERLAAGIAIQAAVAIEKARLFDREQAARTEAEERARAAVALEYVGDGVFLVDREGVVRLWNPAAEAITGLRAERVVGRPAADAIGGWDAIEASVPVAESPAGEGTRARTLPLEVGGRELWLSLYGVGFDAGTVYAFRDVTDDRRLEELRADLIATVSHELRTPLAAVYGAAKTVLRPGLDPQLQASLLEVVASETERLNRIVDEILLSSQLDAGRVTLLSEAVDSERLVEGVLEAARARADALDLRLARNGSVPAVDADPEKLRQVLANLVDNALKYGDGPVEIGVEPVGRSVRLSVRDRGPGIPKREQERIFEKFYRLDPNLSSGVGGTGLGLYISRELVRRMRGRMWVESEDGEGATFVVELPAAG